MDVGLVGVKHESLRPTPGLINGMKQSILTQFTAHVYIKPVFTQKTS